MGGALSRVSLRAKLGVLALVPLVGVTYFAAGTALERRADSAEMAALDRLIHLSVAVGNVTHEVQKERGATSVYVSTEGESYGVELRDQWVTTDVPRAELSIFLDENLAELPEAVARALDPVVEELDRLEPMRSEAIFLGVDPTEVLDFYTDLNAGLLASTATVATSATNAELAQGVVAYTAFLRGKENAGRERAQLAQVFAEGQFGPGVHSLVASLIANQSAFQRTFLDFATPEIRAFFLDRQSHAAVTTMTLMENTALANEPPFDVEPTAWFETATDRIDLLKQVEDAQSAYILDLSSTLSAEAQAAFRDSVLIAIGFTLLTAGLAALIGRSIAIPMNLIGERATTIARGDLKAEPLGMTGSDEIAKLGRRFDVMSHSLTLIRDQLRTITSLDADSDVFDEKVPGELGEVIEDLAQQAEALMKSQGELTEAYRELSEQSDELRASEEELQSSNDGLREIGARLVEQRNEAEMRSGELSIAYELVEEKARDLELASKYKSEFLANMSHELRTPLNSMLILSRSFSKNRQGNLTDEQVQEAEVIHAGGVSLLDLINDILDLSKVEAGMLSVVMEPVELGTFSAHVKEVFSPVMSEKGLELRVILKPGVPASITTDAQRAQQIIKNLVSNAAKFTRAGSVTIEIAPVDESTVFSRGDLIPSAALAISVTDTGVGIPKEKQRLIFEAFQQADGSTSREYGGTGLGLTISRQLTNLLGGELHLESKEGVGSTFTLFLPVGVAEFPMPGDAADRHDATAPAGETVKTVELDHVVGDSHGLSTPPFADDRHAIGVGDKSVLIVEDNPAFARLLAKLARGKGYKVLVSSDGASGLRLAASHRPTGILLDLGLPDMSGADVLEILKGDTRTGQIPVHVISGGSGLASMFDKGAAGVLTKPVTDAQLSEVFSSIQERSGELNRILLVEDDEGTAIAVRNLLSGDEAELIVAPTGTEALSKLRSGRFGCMILDLSLPDMSGSDLLAAVEADKSITTPPVVIYTGQELDQAEHAELEALTASIVIKGSASPERLLSEISLFLHGIDSTVPVPPAEIDQELNQTVLVVDDDARNCFAISKVLRDAGLTVKLATNGEESLTVLDTIDGIDIVVMDIMMPVMDGYEAIEKIRAQTRFEHLPIIAVTAKALPEDRARCLDVGANDYVAKPIDEDKLLSAIRVLLFEDTKVPA
ncbi:MAG: response regulator [Actinomycetia bacterium]|nr:response regulator [Actinomycetes bacterium]